MQPYRVRVYRKQDPFFSELLADWIRFYPELTGAAMFADAHRIAVMEFSEPCYIRFDALTAEELVRVQAGYTI